jgi:hypothetical protein
VFLLPRLRRHWRVADPRPLPDRAAWAMAAVLAAIAVLAALVWSSSPLPPADTRYYQDLMYHLALVQELTRTMPFEVPQLAGEPLRYHYLSDAHMASASMIGGVPPATVLLRLWLVPVAAAGALLTGALARDLTGRWWAAPLAAAGAFVGLPLTLGSTVTANGGNPVTFVSPSQTYAMPFVLLVVALALDVLRGRRLGAAWVLVPALGLACAGSKASALPPVLAGLLLVLVLRRSAHWRPLLALTAVLAAAVLAGTSLFTGGGAGTLRLQPLALLAWTPPYRATLGAADPLVSPGLLLDGLDAAGFTDWLFVGLIVLWWLTMQAPRLAGLRIDDVGCLLGGALLAGAGAAFVFAHPSASQVYFFAGAVPFGVLLTVRLLAGAWPGRAAALAAFAIGAAAELAAPAVSRPDPPAPGVPAPPGGDELAPWAWSIAVPILRVAALVLAVAVVAVLLRRAEPRLPTWLRDPGAGRWPRSAVLGAVVAALLGASVAAGGARAVGRVVNGPAPAPPRAPSHQVTAAEMRAALWLDAHADDDDVVATNVHCQPVQTRPHCDARAFWVAGLGGHRTLVESWGYSDQAVAAHGRDNRSYGTQPAPDPAVFALNERVFTAPTPADLAELRARGVRWLFADTRAGQVSPVLATLAPVRYTSGPVTVHELR